MAVYNYIKPIEDVIAGTLNDQINVALPDLCEFVFVNAIYPNADVNVYMNQELTPEQKTILDTVVANTRGRSNLKIFQISSVANSGILTPEMVDYRHIGLFKKSTESKGLLMQVEFYENFENNIYTNKIVEEIYTYIEQNPLYLGQQTLVNWFNVDDSIGYTTNFTYMFLTNEIIEFGIKKRNNVLSTAKLYSFQQIGANAYSLLDYCQAEMSIYVQGNTVPLLSKVNQSVGIITGMTQPIADTINAILSNL